MSEWQPIETAPRDGTIIDLWVDNPKAMCAGPGRVCGCWHYQGQWWTYDERGDDQCRTEVCNATHWMPLPQPPETTP